MHGPYFIPLAILTFITVTSFLIVLHELGHYLTARAFGLKAKAFSLGLGPEIAGFSDRHGTRWKIAPIPLGGYVKFHGEMHPGAGTAEEAAHPQSFARLARWKRALVIFAGPFVNLLICAAILGGLYAKYGEPRITNTIESVVPGSPADSAQLRPGDRLVRWDGRSADGSQAFVRHVKVNPGRTISLEAERDGQLIRKELEIERVPVADRFGNRAEIGRIGINFGVEMHRFSEPFSLIAAAVRETGDMMVFQTVTIWQMIKGERSLKEISGPIRLAKFSGEQFLIGWTALIYFSAILSVAVAFMNLLPVPGLDGGYLALYAVEGAMRRNLSKKTFANAVKAGYVCVLALMVFAFSNDLRVLLAA